MDFDAVAIVLFFFVLIRRINCCRVIALDVDHRFLYILGQLIALRLLNSSLDFVNFGLDSLDFILAIRIRALFSVELGQSVEQIFEDVDVSRNPCVGKLQLMMW